MSASRDEVTTFLIRQARMMRADSGCTPSAERLAGSLSVEHFGYPQDRTMYRAVVLFRHLNTPDRIRAAASALRELDGAA